MITPLPGPARGELEAYRAAYRRYRRHEARRLVTLLPREAVRPLYRRAREALADGPSGPKDPLAVLAAYLVRYLPLPPFPVWVEDFRRNPAAHLAELEPRGVASLRGHPVVPRRLLPPAERRSFGAGGRRWAAILRIYPRAGAWSGFMEFREEGGPAVAGPSFWTPEVFRERTGEEVRRRFREFEERTLEAFLRSVSP